MPAAGEWVGRGMPIRCVPLKSWNRTTAGTCGSAAAAVPIMIADAASPKACSPRTRGGHGVKRPREDVGHRKLEVLLRGGEGEGRLSFCLPDLDMLAQAGRLPLGPHGTACSTTLARRAQRPCCCACLDLHRTLLVILRKGVGVKLRGSSGAGSSRAGCSKNAEACGSLRAMHAAAGGDLCAAPPASACSSHSSSSTVHQPSHCALPHLGAGAAVEAEV